MRKSLEFLKNISVKQASRCCMNIVLQVMMHLIDAVQLAIALSGHGLSKCGYKAKLICVVVKKKVYEVCQRCI